MTDKTQALVDKYKAQLDEWKAQLDQLKAKADKEGAATRIEFDKIINELELKMVALRDKVNQMESAAGEAREKLGKGVEEAYDDLSKALNSAIKGFKK